MVGKTIDHYRITEKLGGGGMGVVYLAEDTRLERSVAIKFLPAAYFEDEQAVKRFQPLAKAAAALNHPHLCMVLDVGEQDPPPPDGTVPRFQSRVIDMHWPRMWRYYDKGGYKRFLRDLKLQLFGSASYRMTQRRAEAFFENDDHFDLSRTGLID